MEEVFTKPKHKDYSPEQRRMEIRPFAQGRGGEPLMDENRFELNMLMETIIAKGEKARTFKEILRIDKLLRGKADSKIISDHRMRPTSIDQLLERLTQLLRHEQARVMERTDGFIPLQRTTIVAYVHVDTVGTCVVTLEFDTTLQVNRWKIYAYRADISNWPAGTYVISTCEASVAPELFEPQEELAEGAEKTAS